MINNATNKGFSLIELSIVLAVVGLMVVSMVNGFATYTQNRRMQESQRDLQNIYEALIGFAIQNGRLPCPDVDGINVPGFGIEDRQGPNNECTAPVGGPAGAPVAVGFLPFVDLGISGVVEDPWGFPYAYAVVRSFANDIDGTPDSAQCPAAFPDTPGVSFETCAQGRIFIHDSGGFLPNDPIGNGNCNLPACLLIAQNVVAVFYSFGEVSFGVFSVHEQDNMAAAFGGVGSDPNDLVYVSRQYSREGPNRFDDQIMWIPSSILVNRMIQAGRLP
jgi:prepilin-type N-terminal cleavage/methylation domain-containing protein